MMKNGILSVICLIVISFSSCIFKNNQKDKQIINTSIKIPEFDRHIFLCTNDTMNYSLYNKNLKEFAFKIVVYADSLNCIDCDLNLIEWKQHIREIQKRDLNVCFLFILNINYLYDIKKIMQRDNFHYSIWFDKDKYFAKLNNFPEDVKFITFLLNKENKILLTGNPINNSNNWNFYINTINKLSVSS
jgi:hypothetical protein